METVSASAPATATATPAPAPTLTEEQRAEIKRAEAAKAALGPTADPVEEAIVPPPMDASALAPSPFPTP